MFRQYHFIHKEVPPRASPSRSSLLSLSYGFPSSVLYCYGGISQNASGSNLGNLVSVRRSSDCEPGEGFVKICRVKEKNVWEQEESTCARKMTGMVLG